MNTHSIETRTLASTAFPWLSQLSDRPLEVFYRGKVPAPQRGFIGVVGARKASPRSQAVGAYLGRELARHGLCVVSGLAFGVDAAAHVGALSSKGTTLAVLAHGLDLVYPAAHRGLASRILKNDGGLLSQYPNAVAPRKHHFPQRNRLIAGLCRGVVVVQAAERSGSLLTARYALEEGRDVFVVPGEFNDPAFAGSHRWIRQGAILVDSVAEILEEWGIAYQENPSPRSGLEKFCRPFQRFFSGDLFSRHPQTRTHLLKALRQALCSGECIQLAPQCFVYLGK